MKGGETGEGAQVCAEWRRSYRRHPVPQYKVGGKRGQGRGLEGKGGSIPREFSTQPWKQRRFWVCIPALTLTSCVALGK